MKIDLEKIAKEAFTDELQKIAMPPMPNIGGISRTLEARTVAAHEAAQRAAKQVAQKKPVVKPM
jgi:hypothetical protein